MGQTGCCVFGWLRDYGSSFRAGHLAIHARDFGCEPYFSSVRIQEILDNRRARENHEAFTIKLIGKPKCISDTSVTLHEGEIRFLSSTQEERRKTLVSVSSTFAVSTFSAIATAGSPHFSSLSLPSPLIISLFFLFFLSVYFWLYLLLPSPLFTFILKRKSVVSQCNVCLLLILVFVYLCCYSSWTTVNYPKRKFYLKNRPYQGKASLMLHFLWPFMRSVKMRSIRRNVSPFLVFLFVLFIILFVKVQRIKCPAVRMYFIDH